jgi:hypothetical protein
VVALACLAWPGAATGSAYDCQGDSSATGFPAPARTERPLVFGIFPGGRAGAVIGPQKEAKPEEPRKILAALDDLRGGRPFVVHLYLEFTNGSDMPGRIAAADALIDRYRAAGMAVEYVLAYRPKDRRGDPDVVDYVAFVRRMVGRLGPRLRALQITNEVTNSASPDASDGAYPGARDALVQGVIAAKQEARGQGLEGVEIGFNWFYRLDPGTEQSFWEHLRDRGGQPFVESLDWVGVDVYPGTYFPPPPVSRGSSVLNALSFLRECLMPIPGIPEQVPIHITENGWPTGAGRSYAEQEAALREMIEAAYQHRGTYNLTDYRWFALRDGDSSDPDFQQGYGLMRDDYRPKPAFAAYRQLVARFGPPPGASLPAGPGAARAPTIRLAVRPRRAVTGRRTRFVFTTRTPRGGRLRPLAGTLVRIGRRRIRTNRRGRATMTIRFRRPGVRAVRGSRRGYRGGFARVRVLRGVTSG